MKCFHVSNFIAVLGLLFAYLWAGFEGVFITALLIFMEVSLSFDNAVVNATILKDMSEKWQKRFLTWGMVIAVFGMRLLFPILLVSFATELSVLEVTTLALEKPDEYSKHILASNVQIAAFGGMFLLMVFLHFIFDESREIHWLGKIEKKLSKAGKLEAVEIVMALSVLIGLHSFLPDSDKLNALFYGVVGVLLYVVINSIMTLIMGKENASANKELIKYGAKSGLMGFLYLEVLDMSFSLDGVVGAFAISKDVVIIMLGLGVGAMFVRSLTIYLVRKNTLKNYIFLEHGAHYGIGALAVIMLISTMLHISEVVTGLIGGGFIAVSLWSSIIYNRKNLS